MNRPIFRGSVVLLCLAVLILVLPAMPALSVGFCSEQFGTTGYDSVNAITNDGTNLIVGGFSNAALPGQTHKGVNDMFIRRYDGTCAVSWTREFGTKKDEYVRGLATDGSGRVFIGGDTYGRFKGEMHAGGRDAVVRAYSPAGKVLWTDQFGTNKDDLALAICLSGTKLIVAGETDAALAGQHYTGDGDAFVRAYRASSGKVVWTREFGTKGFDRPEGVAAHGGAVFVTGDTDGSFKGHSNAGQTDAFVRKYSASGVAGFTTQFGTSDYDNPAGIAADSNGEVVVGSTNGSFPTFTNPNPGTPDGYVYAVNGSGANVWTQQFGTSSSDVANALVISGSSVYVVGHGPGGLGEAFNQGLDDMFVGWMDRATGSSPAFAGYGTAGDDLAYSITAAGGGIVWPAGATSGTFLGSNIGSYDAYLFTCCS